MDYNNLLNGHLFVLFDGTVYLRHSAKAKNRIHTTEKSGSTQFELRTWMLRNIQLQTTIACNSRLRVFLSQQSRPFEVLYCVLYQGKCVEKMSISYFISIIVRFASLVVSV